MPLRLASCFLVLACFAPTIGLADDPQDGDRLPPPRQVSPPAQPPVPQPMLVPVPRRNPYDVWLYYGVGRQGRFRPRVIYSPYGAYYLYNGAPFPWTGTNQRDFAPYIVEPPEGYGPPR